MRQDKLKTLEYNRRYRAENKDVISEKMKEYRQANKELIQKTYRAYCESPRGRFMQQKTQAKKRGISWELSFDEWWEIWQTSGKWDLRGFGRGKFCMSRFGDKGPYHKDNVIISSTEENKGRRV